MSITAKDVCDIVDIKWNHDEINMKLYEKAFTHKSAVKDRSQCNERIEFVGDAVLNLVVGHYLYERYPDENEGFLTRIRTKLVSGQNLCKIAKRMNFGNFIKMNDRAMAKEWNNNDRILEDAFESFIGALFIDKGFDASKQWILNHVPMEDEDEMVKDTNYKDILMKHAHTNGMNAPEYKVLKENGPEHEKLFTIQVYINSLLMSTGREVTKKKSEQIAALKALQCLGVVD